MSTTWNPSDNSNLTLSNGNLTATAQTTANTWNSVRGNTSKSSGKWYFEVQISAIDGSSGWMGGIADGSATLSSSYIGASVHGIGLLPVLGNVIQIYQNGSATNYSINFSLNQNIAVAVDVGNTLIWFRNASTSSSWTDGSGGLTGNPANGTGGITYTATNPIFIGFSGNFAGSVADTGILNPLGGGVIPSGFSSWDTVWNFEAVLPVLSIPYKALGGSPS